MPRLKLVAMFVLFAVLSAGMLLAQPAVMVDIPAYVYSTEVVASAQPGEYNLTVTAIFTPRTGVKKVELTLEKYVANTYYGQWLPWQYRVPATFGGNPGFPYSVGKKVITPAGSLSGVPTYPNLRAGVYTVHDGSMRSLVTVGNPDVSQVPDFSDIARFLYSRNDAGKLTLVTENRHPSYVMAWQSTGTAVAVGFDAVLTTPIGVYTVGPVSSLQSQPLQFVVCDMVMRTCTTTQVAVRDPTAGGGKK